MTENNDYLSSQIITYLGNKRSLLSEVEKEIINIKKKLAKQKLVCADLFSGSGIVARLMKQHSEKLYANDLENYSCTINQCYLSNKSEFDEAKYQEYLTLLLNRLEHDLKPGLITSNYAPLDDEAIKSGERVFYTHENALIIDTIRLAIDDIEDEYKKYFLAPLLYEASVHVNTAGVFKGFYKDTTTGVGKFGGNGENALNRIKGKIELKPPVLSNFECEYKVFQEDANDLVKKIKDLDIVYIDPPYNQHPYGSNYFMLNVILDNKIEGKVSKVSGIPEDWNRSDYNKKTKVMEAFANLIKTIDSKYIIVSYNSEGFVTYEQMENMLKQFGKLKVKKINYNTYRGSRNLRNRDKYVFEYLFILERVI